MKRVGKDETGFSRILGIEEKDRMNSEQSSLKSYPLWVALYVIKSIYKYTGCFFTTDIKNISCRETPCIVEIKINFLEFGLILLLEL